MNKSVEDFLDKVCGEIKYKGVHGGISEELKSHVNELIDYYMETGLSEAEASVKAVQQMGDPIKIGQDLNITHRPKTEWTIIALIGVMVLMGAVSLYTLANDSSYYLSLEEFFSTYISYIFIGSGVFLALYFFDYRKIERYSLHILIGTLAFVIMGQLFLSGGTRYRSLLRHLYHLLYHPWQLAKLKIVFNPEGDADGYGWLMGIAVVLVIALIITK